MSRSLRALAARLRPVVAGVWLVGALLAGNGTSGEPLGRPAAAPDDDAAARATQIRAEQERRETTLRDLEGELRANAGSRAHLESEVGALEAGRSQAPGGARRYGGARSRRRGADRRD